MGATVSGRCAQRSHADAPGDGHAEAARSVKLTRVLMRLVLITVFTSFMVVGRRPCQGRSARVSYGLKKGTAAAL